ncbi:hypothetical protein [Bacillus massiliigorillae]|uniref:hypothetical protein n=1 Tax=Bacillus massiliigorillae TaxID=1243664 RepID=UPI0003A9CE93|nr:hypothetical protein [Bacillus massiliigorillae]
MQTVEMADAYCEFLESNSEDEVFIKYQIQIDEEIQAYKTTDEEIEARIQATVPMLDIL